MKKQNTLYIAEPIFSEKLQAYDSDISFPPIKKIGITTDGHEKRQKELLGTSSPIKVSIVKAWTNIDARKTEKILHTILDNSRLDGEYFWDGNESLVDAVTNFINSYHPEAIEITIDDSADVKAATKAADKVTEGRIYSQVLPFLESSNIKHSITTNGRAVKLDLGEYYAYVATRRGGKFTFTVFSRTKNINDALVDFPGTQGLSANASGDSTRKARIPLTTFDEIKASINSFISKSQST